jgi:Glycosyl transferase family 2
LAIATVWAIMQGVPPQTAPRLTAMLLMPRAFDELTGTLTHLRAQTIRSQIQVVIVTRRGREPEVDRRQLDGFAAIDIVAVDAMPTVASGFAAGVRYATADVVALVEDHVFVEPDWAARVCEAFGEGCAAVAPLMLNANPATATSWMNFVVCFTEAVTTVEATEVEYGPGHNTAYRRSVLEQYEGELQRLIQTERNFHYRLRADGHVLRAEPRARLRHTNISIPYEALRQGFLGGVMFAKYRAARMSMVERVARTLLAPLVPLVRLSRLARAHWPARRAVGVPAAGWLLVPAGLVAHAAGEAVGYWPIVRNVESKYEFFELHRIACVRPEERRLMTSGAGDWGQSPACPGDCPPRVAR